MQMCSLLLLGCTGGGKMEYKPAQRARKTLVHMPVCKQITYLEDKGRDGNLVKQDNSRLIFCLPATKETHIVVICDLEKWR